MGDLLPFQRPEDTSDWEETPNAVRLLKEIRARESSGKTQLTPQAPIQKPHPEAQTPLSVLLATAEDRTSQDGMTPLTHSLERIQGGWVIERTDTYVIDVVRQLFNWRLHVATADGYGEWYEHGYCFFDTGPDALVLAIKAGQQWADPLHTDPIGFDKKAF